jgi:hypothetical protein
MATEPPTGAGGLTLPPPQESSTDNSWLVGTLPLVLSGVVALVAVCLTIWQVRLYLLQWHRCLRAIREHFERSEEWGGCGIGKGGSQWLLSGI